MRSHIGWRGERNIIYNGVKIYPVKGKLERKSLKRTISASGDLGPLYEKLNLVGKNMVAKLDN